MTRADFVRVYGSEARVQWFQALPCLACGRGPSVNVHTATGGMSRKADADTIVPLCHVCHHELHQYGQQTFEMRHDLDLDACAQQYAARWDALLAQQPLHHNARTH